VALCGNLPAPAATDPAEVEVEQVEDEGPGKVATTSAPGAPAASPAQVAALRAQLVEMVRADLLGPAGGTDADHVGRELVRRQYALKNSSSPIPACRRMDRAVPSFSVAPFFTGTVTGVRLGLVRM